MSKKIKVAGYTQKINYTDGISYRPFSTLNKPLEEGTIFSAGNFNVTVNTDEYNSKLFKTKEFSDYFDLDSLKVDDVQLSTIANITTKTQLNLNSKLLKNYAYFGSLKERMRVSLEKIIMTFPAALVFNPYYYDSENNYNFVANGSIKDIDKLGDDQMIISLDYTNMSNPYDINMFEDNQFGVLYNEFNKWRDFSKSYNLYAIDIDGVEYDILGLYENSASSLRVIVKYDEVLFNRVIFDNVIYLKPNKNEIELFYNSLDSLELELLNRQSEPKNTYNFLVREFKDNGIFIETNKRGTWTTSDGYNLDFDNAEYLEYINHLISLCDDIDINSANLIIRQMVSTSLLEFDTVSSDINENNFDSSQKIKSILSVYGRNFDNVKNYIDGIAFANSISYDKEDNAPDKYLREIAKSYGWDIFENQHYIDVLNDTLSKNADNYTKDELDNELWRRLILNTPFLWGAKGTRKAIEFIIQFLGIPRGMISFNEFIYKTKNKLNYNDVETIVDLTTNSQNILDLPLDSEGYPRIPVNNDDMYYQKAGGWYSITGGNNSNIDTNLGNNPHMGGYDSGSAYLNQFKNIVENFEPVKEIDETSIITDTNFFKSYDNGRFDISPIVGDLSNTSDANAFISDKYPLTTEYDDCGCEITYKLKELKVSPIKQIEVFDCNYDYTIYNENGIINFYKGVNQVSVNSECCNNIGGDYIFNFSTQSYVCVYKDIIDCERYQYLEPSNGFAVFKDLVTNENVTIIPYSECCPVGSIPVGNQSDGYRCQIGTDVTDKCIRIDAVYINAIDDTNESFIQYTDGVDGNVKRTYMTAESEYTAVDETLLKTADIIMSHDGYVNTLDFNDFIAQTGSFLSNTNNITVTFFMSGLPVSVPEVSFVISYVDCPPTVIDENCLKLEYLSTTNREYLMFLDISYLSEISNSVVNLNNETPTFATPSNLFLDKGYNLNVSKRHSKLTIIRSGTMIELDLNQVVGMTNPIPDNNVTYSYPFTLLGIQYTLNFKYISCPDCVNYNTFSFVDGSTIINQNVNIAKFNDTNNGYEFLTVISAECCPLNTDPVLFNGLYYCKERPDLISFRMHSSSSSGIGTGCPVNSEIPLSDTYYTDNFGVGGNLYYDIDGNNPFGVGGVPNTSRFVIYNEQWYSLSYIDGVITNLTPCGVVPMPLTFFASGGESQKLSGGANATDDGTVTFTYYEIQYRPTSSSGSWTSFNVTYQPFVSVFWEKTGVAAGTYTVRCRMLTTTNQYSNWKIINDVVVI